MRGTKPRIKTQVSSLRHITTKIQRFAFKACIFDKTKIQTILISIKLLCGYNYHITFILILQDIFCKLLFVGAIHESPGATTNIGRTGGQ